MQYKYDATGNRIYKEYTKSGVTTRTWYIRDPQGNVLSVYSNNGGAQTFWKEQHLYGSSRLGMFVPEMQVTGTPGSATTIWNQSNRIRYELTNHLGNVLATISDVPSTIYNMTDYAPFGMQQVGRNYSLSGTYRYGFNGKENDNEVKGEGNQQDYGMRVYDPRIGRFLSGDPLQAQRTWMSPYNFVQNSPIIKIDPSGGLDDDYMIRKNGDIIVNKTDDKFDRFYVETSQKQVDYMLVRSYKLAGQLEKNGNGLVAFPEKGENWDSYGVVESGGQSKGVKNGKSFDEFVGAGDNFVKPITAAGLFGILNEVKVAGITISFGDMSSNNGSDPAVGEDNTFHHGGHGHMGARSGLDADFRYVGNNGHSFQGTMDSKKFSIEKNEMVYRAAYRFGFDWKNTYQGKLEMLNGVRTMGGHNDHGHLGMKDGNRTNVSSYVPFNTSIVFRLPAPLTKLQYNWFGY
ncbi:hypothetical protein DVR12_27435 [Chitinophaga silvatica]|uniref:RHS repeat-associated core domain-containing protein n=1 Tax=Chitinophaga silvatica TaxID=2282649 RepID=A0A3E1Y1U5_9BACT|nr:RHS repeat-associated core domain-containing protein [Chitinophaga silvatica]RFS18648.1 hypothetical protein DVR12_27435 [Chitinophaga silvatica]